MKFLAYLIIAAFLYSCTSLKPAYTVMPARPASASQKDVKFIDGISVTAPPKDQPTSKPNDAKKDPILDTYLPATPINEELPSIKPKNASELEAKYSVLLQVQKEYLVNTQLLQKIDEWLGTKYRLGGTTQSGIDCSAFVQTIIKNQYNIDLPRTAREQYKASEKISSTDLQCGDLVFFNTTGGVSHVGIYLQNNKFVHASSSRGVIISDMYEPYYVQRLVSAARLLKKEK